MNQLLFDANHGKNVLIRIYPLQIACQTTFKVIIILFIGSIFISEINFFWHGSILYYLTYRIYNLIRKMALKYLPIIPVLHIKKYAIFCLDNFLYGFPMIKYF